MSLQDFLRQRAMGRAGPMQKVMGFLGGPTDPMMSPQQNEQRAAQQRMAIAASLLQNSGPTPKGTTGLLQPFGTALQAGQQAGAFATEQIQLANADALRAKLMQAQMSPQQNNPFGVVNPSDFTPESMRKFARTQDYGDLVPVDRNFGRINFRDYTPESIERYKETGNPGDLVRVANIQFGQTPGGGTIGLDPITGRQVTTPITPQEGTQQAADRAGAVAEATTTGEARGGLKSVRLEAAQRRLDRVKQASEALGIGGPVIGQASGLFPKGQDLNQANAQLLTELTALTRIPGVGSQSDLEQRLAQLQLPTPEMYPSVRANAIKELEAFMADLDVALGEVEGEQPKGLPEIIPNSASGPPIVDWKDWRGR